jgi:hypothetical protein
MNTSIGRRSMKNDDNLAQDLVCRFMSLPSVFERRILLETIKEANPELYEEVTKLIETKVDYAKS